MRESESLTSGLQLPDLKPMDPRLPSTVTTAVAAAVIELVSPKTDHRLDTAPRNPETISAGNNKNPTFRCSAPESST